MPADGARSIALRSDPMMGFAEVSNYEGTKLRAIPGLCLNINLAGIVSL